MLKKGSVLSSNGGALNPKGLAEKVEELVGCYNLIYRRESHCEFWQVREKGLNLRVAYLSGDDVYSKVGKNMPTSREALWRHLDADNQSVKVSSLTYAFLTNNGIAVPMVSAHIYLGARGIVEA